MIRAVGGADEQQVSTAVHELPRPPIVTISAAGDSLPQRLRELWAFRDLLGVLAVRHIQVRYKQVVLGALWGVLQPVVAACLFALVFSSFLGVKTGELPYLLFAYPGVLAWSLFAAILTGAAGSLVDNAQLLTKVYFPRLVVPLSVTGYATLDFALALPVLGVMMAAYAHAPGLQLLAMPLVLLGIVACALGAGVLLAALTVRYRDLRLALPYLVQIWFFSTPVVYPLEAAPAPFRPFMAINPMTGLVEAFRSSTLGTPLDGRVLLISLSMAVLLPLLALAYFVRYEGELADVV